MPKDTWGPQTMHSTNQPPPHVKMPPSKNYQSEELKPLTLLGKIQSQSCPWKCLFLGKCGHKKRGIVGKKSEKDQRPLGKSQLTGFQWGTSPSQRAKETGACARVLFKMTPPLHALLPASAQPRELSFPGLPGHWKSGGQAWILQMHRYRGGKGGEGEDNYSR